MVDTVVDQPTLTIRSSQIGEAYILYVVVE